MDWPGPDWLAAGRPGRAPARRRGARSGVCGLWRVVMAWVLAVVMRPAARIAERLIGVAESTEPRGRLRVLRPGVGMGQVGGTAVGARDLLRGRVGGNTQNLIGITVVPPGLGILHSAPPLAHLPGRHACPPGEYPLRLQVENLSHLLSRNRGSAIYICVSTPCGLADQMARKETRQC